MIRYHELLKAALNTSMRLKEFDNPQEDFAEIFGKFLPIAMETIELTSLPKFKFVKYVDSPGQPTFGQYINGKNVMQVALADRHPVDILRTIAHELVHYKQDIEHQLNKHSGDTGSPEENQAHHLAGIVMRHFNKMYPEYLKSKPITLKSKKSINNMLEFAPSGDGFDPLDNEENYRKQLQAIDIYWQDRKRKIADELYQKKIDNHPRRDDYRKHPNFYRDNLKRLEIQAGQEAYNKTIKNYEEAIKDLNMRMPNGYRQYQQSEKEDRDRRLAQGGHMDWGRGDM